MRSYHCHHCHAEQTFIQHSRSEYCDKPDCQRAKAQSFLENQKQQSLQQLKTLCERKLSVDVYEGMNSPSRRLSQHNQETIPVVAIVPANRNTISQSSEQRRAEFLQHLSDTYDDVENGNKPLEGVYTEALFPEYETRENDLLGKACATCKGHCCRLGKTHAFQDYSSLKYFLDAQEERPSKQQMLDLYAMEFPENSYTDGCVFQGEKGCTLTREKRAFTCNNYQCEGLGNYHAMIRQTNTSLSFVAAVEKDEIYYASVYDDEDFLQVK